MRAEAQRLEEWASSVADGKLLDWKALEVGASAQERRWIGHLRLVERVAESHRDSSVIGASTLPPADAPPESGQQRWGRLLLAVKIGEGGFGEVYRARDSWLDRDVALKLLKPSALEHLAVQRVIAEARTLASLRHRNVVGVHGADRHAGRVGLWMELIEGRTLAQIVAADGPYSAREAAVIGQELCRALSAVHGAGIVHRDIKAQNVMRESGGRVVLMDFGAGTTPLYSAPELLDGAEPSVASDIYAVGVLLYHLVSGKFPIPPASRLAILAAHAHGKRTRLADQRADLPDDFVAVVERATSADPANRPASAGELLDALTLVCSPRGSMSPPAAALPARRRPGWLTAVGGGLLMAVIALCASLAWSARELPRASATDASIRVLAVLPLRADAEEHQYFADGMTDALQQGLGHVTGVRVISRTSVDKAQASGGALPEIARSLNADAVLEGSVSNDDERVRVTLRLIHAGSDTAVWSQSFDEIRGEVFALQTRLARAVAGEMQMALSPRVAAVSQPRHPEAYDEFLRGRFAFRRQTQQGMETALQHFQRAIEIEPTYARAWTGMAGVYLSLGGDFAVMSEVEGARLARDAAGRAITLDAGLAEAHAIRAGILFHLDWDFAAAETAYTQAIELEPGLVAPREQYASFLTSRGRFDEAFAQLAQARALDPLSATTADATAAAHYHARQFDRATSEIDRAIALDPTSMGPQVGLGRILNAQGRHEEAIAQFARTSAATGLEHPYFHSEIAQAEIALGREREARKRIAFLEAQIGQASGRVTAYMLATAYARLDRDRAFHWLEEAYRQPNGRVLWLLADPRMDPLRADPRFAGFLRRLGLP